MNKAELRKYIRRLKEQYKASAPSDSERIMQTLEAAGCFQAAQTVLMYYSLPDEVDTHAFIEKWCQKKRVLLPVVVGDELELRMFSSTEELKTGSFGIAEPTGDYFTEYQTIDLVVVPGMAFDKKGNRLGRGKGYYDRLLPKLPNACKLGVCFPYQFVDQVPTEATDIRMDAVIC